METKVGPPSVPSLKELSVRKATSSILQHHERFSEFSKLDGRSQKLLFEELCKDALKLEALEAEKHIFRRLCPRADQGLYTASSSTRIAFPEEDYDDDDESGEEPKLKEKNDAIDENPYRKIEYFQKKWSYKSSDDEGDTENREGLLRDTAWKRWQASSVYYDPDDSIMKVMDMVRGFNFDEHYKFIDNSFYTRISSQLLLYRLSVMFGMPERRESDGYKVCWEITLHHSSRKGTLDVYDYKGAASAAFTGSSEASDDALDLLGFITQDDVPHTYDGTLAGTVA